MRSRRPAEPLVSLVVPVFNEEESIDIFLSAVMPFLEKAALRFEVVFVNDGSRDETPEIARAFARGNPIVRVVDNPGNRGKGYSVRHGMLEANVKVAQTLFSMATVDRNTAACIFWLQARGGWRALVEQAKRGQAGRVVVFVADLDLLPAAVRLQVLDGLRMLAERNPPPPLPELAVPEEAGTGTVG